MTLGSKIKRKLNNIGSKIQDGYNRIGGKKALLGGALSILGASAAGILSHSLNEFIHKPLEAVSEIKNSEYVILLLLKNPCIILAPLKALSCCIELVHPVVNVEAQFLYDLKGLV